MKQLYFCQGCPRFHDSIILQYSTEGKHFTLDAMGSFGNKFPFGQPMYDLSDALFGSKSSLVMSSNDKLLLLINDGCIPNIIQEVKLAARGSDLVTIFYVNTDGSLALTKQVSEDNFIKLWEVISLIIKLKNSLLCLVSPY